MHFEIADLNYRISSRNYTLGIHLEQNPHIMHALQLLKIAKARNIMTDREPSGQLRLVVTDESDSAARI